jgi:hypothetical protein
MSRLIPVAALIALAIPGVLQAEYPGYCAPRTSCLQNQVECFKERLGGLRPRLSLPLCQPRQTPCYEPQTCYRPSRCNKQCCEPQCCKKECCKKQCDIVLHVERPQAVMQQMAVPQQQIMMVPQTVMVPRLVQTSSMFSSSAFVGASALTVNSAGLRASSASTANSDEVARALRAILDARRANGSMSASSASNSRSLDAVDADLKRLQEKVDRLCKTVESHGTRIETLENR